MHFNRRFVNKIDVLEPMPDHHQVRIIRKNLLLYLV